MERDIKYIVGMTKQEAIEEIKKTGFDSRVVAEDGVYFIVTCDLDMCRVNLYIEKGIVVKSDIG